MSITKEPEPSHCGICKDEAPKYVCPRCNVQYCSIACYKSLTHIKCSEALAHDNFSSSLRHEKADDETKRQMLEILKRFQSFDVSEDLEAEKSTLGFLGELRPEDVDKMTTEELMKYIGPDALRRFEEDLKDNPKFIEEELKRWKPWWLSPPVQDANEEKTIKIPEPLEELPPLAKLTKQRPPEMLWNNLVELVYLYTHLYRMYGGEMVEFSNDFAEDFLALSKVLSSQQFAHASVIHALRSAEASVIMECELFLSDETKALLLDDVILILVSPDYTLSTLADIQRILERSLKIRREFFAAAKKIYFYNVWLNDEIQEDRELVATVFTSMVALVAGYKDKILSRSVLNRDELSALEVTLSPNNKHQLDGNGDERDLGKNSSTRRPSKKAVRFSLMVAGQSGLGKTTFLATCFDGHLLPPIVEDTEGTDKARMFERTKDLELEVGYRLHLEIIDTPGYGDDCTSEAQAEKLLKYLEGTFDEVFSEEQRIHRNPKFEEHRIHALLYFIEPTVLGLKQFDIDFMKLLAPRVNIIPIIAKADGLTDQEKQDFKKLIMDDIARNEITIYDFANGVDRDESEGEVLRNSIPFSVIGATFPHTGKKRGRQYLWGFVDCDDPKHCDLTSLRKTILSVARDDLREHTEDNLYEKYRTEKLLSLQNAK